MPRAQSHHRRTVAVRVYLTPAEAADLAHVAEGWRCRTGQAAGLILSDRIARWRRHAPELGPLGLIAAASASVLLVGLSDKDRRARGAG